MTMGRKAAPNGRCLVKRRKAQNVCARPMTHRLVPRLRSCLTEVELGIIARHSKWRVSPWVQQRIGITSRAAEKTMSYMFDPSPEVEGSSERVQG